MNKLLGSLAFLLITQTLTAQVVIHQENFSSGLNGYTTSLVTSIAISSASPSSGYGFASGGNNVFFDNNFSGRDTLFSPTISTAGFEEIKLIFGQLRVGLLLPREIIIFNGTSWVSGPSFPGAGTSWSSTDTLNLGPSVNENPNFRFAVVVTTNSSTRKLRFDDFQVLATATFASTYYSKSTGALNNLATWGTNTDGSGDVPLDFTTPGITYIITNNASPTLSASWTVSGADSRVEVQSGSNFIIPSSFTYSGLLQIDAGGTVTIDNPTTTGITFEDLAATSTVVYNQGGVRAATYGNLEINANVFLTGNIRVVGFAEFNDYINLNGFNAVFEQSIGGIAVEGTPTSNLEISGPGVINDLLIGASDFNNVTINKPGSVVTLDNIIAINGVLNIVDGDLDVGNFGLTIRSTGSISYGTNGILRSGPNSTIRFESGSGSAGDLKFRSGFNSIQQLLVGRTASLASDLVVTGNAIFNSGSYSFNVGANSLSTIGFTGAGINNISTIASSSLTITGTSSTITLPTTIAQLNNFTINRSAGGVVRLAGPLTVNGSLNLLLGSFQIQTNTLTLKGGHTITSGTFSPTNGIVQYFQESNGQTLIRSNYRTLVLNDFTKVFPSGTWGISFIFTPGSAIGHTVTGTTIQFTSSSAQTIPQFEYNNLSSLNGGARVLDSGAVISIRGVFSPGTSNFTTSNSTIAYNGASQSIVCPPGFSYNHLQLSGSGVKTLSNDLRCFGNITVNSGIGFNTNNLGVDIGGNFTNLGSLTLGNSAFTVNGTSRQTFSGPYQLRDLIVTNINDTALLFNSGISDSIRISRQLVFSGGAGYLQTNNKLILQDGARIIDSASTVGPQGSVLGNVKIYRQGNSIPGSPILWNHTSTPVRSADAKDSVLMSGGFFPRRYVESVISSDINIGWENISRTNLEIGRGYATARPGVMIWNGQVNNGNYSYPITLNSSGTPASDGWNLLGNPYPSGISSIAFHAENAGRFNGNVLYIWNANIQSYVTINNTDDFTINSCQGFYVQALGNHTVNFNNAMRSTNNGALLRSTKDRVSVSIKLEGSGEYSDNIKIVLNEQFTEGHDINADAYKLWSEGPVQLASLSTLNSSYAIQAIPFKRVRQSIPLSVKLSSSGMYTFRVDEKLQMDDIDIVIEDTEKRLFHTISSQKGFSFSADGDLKTESRFKLHLLDKETIKEIEDQSKGNQVFAYVVNTKEVIVDLGFVRDNPCAVSIYSLSGLKHMDYVIQKGNLKETFDLSSFPSGLYIIRVQESNGSVNNLKIVLN